MAKGHKKIFGTYCYKGNGCTNRFCEFCCDGDKYEEIKPQDEEGEGLWQQKKTLKTE